MKRKTESENHKLIKSEILTTCKELGFEVYEEYRGKGWRADVYAIKDDVKYVFEIQLSPQSLKKTIERHLKYFNEKIFCCWLFEKPLPELYDKSQYLPLFKVLPRGYDGFIVSLRDRRHLPLREFVEHFITRRIQFSEITRASQIQVVELWFYEMKCWKCGTVNHLYYIASTLSAACNSKIYTEESLWSSNKSEFSPEIMKLVEKFAKTDKGKYLRLSTIEPRYSDTIKDTYISFGCYECDSIFGDWFVHEMEIQVQYGEGVVTKYVDVIDLEEDITMDVEHWCYPGDKAFCFENCKLSEEERKKEISYKREIVEEKIKSIKIEEEQRAYSNSYKSNITEKVQDDYETNIKSIKEKQNEIDQRSRDKIKSIAEKYNHKLPESDKYIISIVVCDSCGCETLKYAWPGNSPLSKPPEPIHESIIEKESTTLGRTIYCNTCLNCSKIISF